MAFSRNSMAATVAGTLSLAMLTGCPGAQAPTAPTTSAAASTAPVASTPASTTPVASAPASTTPGATGTASTAPAPSASAPAPTGKKTILSGTVYDDAGATVEGATVTVKSLDASVPYTATANTAAGSYVVNDVPEGANVEIVVTKDGWTKRRQVGSFQTNANQKNTVNFGGSNQDFQQYFISKYPEIASVEPAMDATGVDVSTVSVKMTLSEALDDQNRRRFEDAVRLLPANAYAAPGLTKYPSLKSSNAAAASAKQESDWDFSVKKGSLFLDDTNTRAAITWDASNTVATFTFAAPLATDRTNAAKYQVALVIPSAKDRITDKDDNQLGTDGNATHDAYDSALGSYKTGFILPGVFANKDLSGSTWDATHSGGSVFATKVDNTDPKLVSVAFSKNVGASSRFELTFNKPIVAYDGTSGGYMAATIKDGTVLKTISFAISDRAGGTKNVNLKGGTNLTNLGGIALDGTGNTNGINGALIGSAKADLEKEFLLVPLSVSNTGVFADCIATGASVALSQAAAVNNGKFQLVADPRNPKTLFVYVINKTAIFDTSVVELKARVEGITDPAGNTLKSADADANQVNGAI